MTVDAYLNGFNKNLFSLLHHFSVTLLCWKISGSNWSTYWGLYTRNTFWAYIMKCHFFCMPEVLTEQPWAMYNAVSELQSKASLSAYFVFQHVNASQCCTTGAFHTYMPLTLESKWLLLPWLFTATWIYYSEKRSYLRNTILDTNPGKPLVGKCSCISTTVAF